MAPSCSAFRRGEILTGKVAPWINQTQRRCSPELMLLLLLSVSAPESPVPPPSPNPSPLPTKNPNPPLPSPMLKSRALENTSPRHGAAELRVGRWREALRLPFCMRRRGKKRRRKDRRGGEKKMDKTVSQGDMALATERET